MSQLIAFRLVTQAEDAFLTSNLGIGLGCLVLGSLIVTGATGAIYTAMLTSTSAERRAALAQRASSPDVLSHLRDKTEQYPTIPNDAHWRISPGVRLAYRLPSNSTAAVHLASLAVFTLLWNAAVVVLAVFEFNLSGQESNQIIQEWLSRPGVSLSGFVLAIFAAIGIYFVYRLIRSLLAAEALGPTQVEVSAQPCFPGEQYEVAITQMGLLRIKWLELWLVCDEEVLFSDGTDTRTETSRVHEHLIIKKEDIAIEPSEPYQYDDTLSVPVDAMHSFVSTNNTITWKVVVKAEAEKWPKLVRTFSIGCSPGKTQSSSRPKTVTVRMDPLLSIQIYHDPPAYRPGEEMRFDYQVDAVDVETLSAVEASVLWQTEGKGDQDFGVHFFERRVPSDPNTSEICALRTCRVQLPLSPLSYHGKILQVRWIIRVRVFVKGGKEHLLEKAFRAMQ